VFNYFLINSAVD